MAESIIQLSCLIIHALRLGLLAFFGAFSINFDGLQRRFKKIAATLRYLYMVSENKQSRTLTLRSKLANSLEFIENYGRTSISLNARSRTKFSSETLKSKEKRVYELSFVYFAKKLIKSFKNTLFRVCKISITKIINLSRRTLPY